MLKSNFRLYDMRVSKWSLTSLFLRNILLKISWDRNEINLPFFTLLSVATTLLCASGRFLPDSIGVKGCAVMLCAYRTFIMSQKWWIGDLIAFWKLNIADTEITLCLLWHGVGNLSCTSEHFRWCSVSRGISFFNPVFKIFGYVMFNFILSLKRRWIFPEIYIYIISP